MDIRLSADDGSGRRVTPGRSCADGGLGAYWHYGYSALLEPGVFSSLAGEALVNLVLHSDTQRYQNASGVYAPGANPTAFLLGEESHLSLLNDRGSLKLRLRSAPAAQPGSCQAPTLDFDGSLARHAPHGFGTWEVASGSGAYRGVGGAGKFRLGDPNKPGTGAEVNPGADNALNLRLFDGVFTVPEPNLEVQVAATYWGGLGLDYLTRRVTVVYEITNTGPGDSFGARVESITSPTPGVTLIDEPAGVLNMPLGPDPGDPPPVRVLGDLRERRSRLFSVRFQLGLAEDSPCDLVIEGCEFDTTLDVVMPDALDIPHARSQTVTVRAPLLPLPL